MSMYKVVYNSDGSIKAVGPNVDEFQPYLNEGDVVKYLGETPEIPKEKLLQEIFALESQQTDRRIREATLTEDGKLWLKNLNDQIAAKRAELAGLT